MKDIQCIQWNYFLEDLLEENPALSQNMWETTLAIAGPDFTQNPMVVEYLMDIVPLQKTIEFVIMKESVNNEILADLPCFYCIEI